MTTYEYKIHAGSLQERFDASRNKVQVYAGGYANGKTAASVVLKTLKVAKEYPGSNILVARSTYPKLNDTIRKELYKWIPHGWVKRWPTKDDNTMILNNGTYINFRYIAQQGRATQESTTSNLLSATYDLIVVDQIEDPEIREKDFDDLLGRLRGMTLYRGDDATMPRTGPRWLVITCNPTRNWFYRKVIRPVHRLATGVHDDNLIVHPKTGDCLIDLVEGSTYENIDNLEIDFVETLEATYKGQMRDRFLLGTWAAYEGLVYPSFDEALHVVEYSRMKAMLATLGRYQVTIVEGYDFGMAVPACYILGFVDDVGNVHLLDGWYEKELTPDEQADRIRACRKDNLTDTSHLNNIFADPQIFRRTTGGKKTVGISLAGIFQDECNIFMQRGNNDILNGLIKVGSYIHVQKFHKNPYTGTYPAPHMYVSSRLQFFIDEINEYYWQRNTAGDIVDKPQDKNDHAMDTVKYLMSTRPKISVLVRAEEPDVPTYMRWHEHDVARRGTKEHRYAR